MLSRKVKSNPAAAEESQESIPTADDSEIMVGSEMEPVGSRLPSSLRRDGRGQQARPHGAPEYEAQLVRGVSFTLSYSGASLVLERDKRVPVNRAEFERLAAAVDVIDFFDGQTRVQRSIRKFRFWDAEGGPVALPAIPDRHLDEVAIGVDPFEAAAMARSLEGQEHTAR